MSASAKNALNPPPLPPPVLVNVIVSLLVSVVIAIPAPACNVNVSFIISAVRDDWFAVPVIARFLQVFCVEPPDPELVIVIVSAYVLPSSNEIPVPAFSFLNSKLSKFTFNNTTYGNRQSAQSPKYQYQISLLFKTSENTNIRLNKTYTDKFYFDDQSNHMSNSYYLLNGSFEISYKNVNISLWLKNIQNTKYAVKGYTFALDPTYEVKDWQSYGMPRTIGLSINVNL